jgi:pimeloyl-ACP methyl ester carboxylesterase
MTPPLRPLPRRAALALLPALAACGTTTVQPLTQPPRGRVVVLRGLLNMFSTGMNQLTFMLRGAGYDATVHNHAEWRGLSARLVEAARDGTLQRPLVVIGHSFGADDAIAMAGRLGAAEVPVDLLVTFDPSWVLAVPRGPKRVLNFHQDRDSYARRLTPGPGFDGRIDNRLVTGESHLSIDKDQELHRQVLEALRGIEGAAHPRATPATGIAPPAQGMAATVPPSDVQPVPPLAHAPANTPVAFLPAAAPPRPAPLPRPPAPPVRARR